MKSELTREKDNTIKLKITVPWSDVEKTRRQIIAKLVKEVQVPGFRKGMAPENVAQTHLAKEKVQEEVLKQLLGTSYNAAVVEHKLSPIINPHVHVESFEEGTDLVFDATTCEEPRVTLNNYKDEVKKITAKSKIVVPGKEDKKPTADEVIQAAMSVVKVEVPKIIVEQEATRLLSQMLDELKTLGLTLDQYLTSRGKKGEELKAEYEERARRDLELEFMLRKIADEEKIVVNDSDIKKALDGVEDANQKRQLEQNPYIVASIIRQQKTLEFLTAL